MLRTDLTFEMRFNKTTMIKTILLTISTLFFINISDAQYSDNYVGNFNGINSYAAVQNYSSLNPLSGITLEAWVNPLALLSTTMAVIGKNYQTSYFLGIQTSGRVVFYPKGGSSFRSKVTSVIPINKWTHIAATYNGTSSIIYINGILDTSTSGFSGAIGVNSDSLFIGADRIGSPTSLFFYGKLDNVRIWGIARTAFQISKDRFGPLEIVNPTGEYTQLKGSFQFDNNVLSYGGTELYIGHARNLTYTNFVNKAVNYLDYNNNLVLNGTTDYFTTNNHIGYNATTAITLEAWIKRDTTGVQPNDMYIINKSGGTNRYNYALWMFAGDGTLKFKINAPGGPSGLISPTHITNGQWTHVAATYNSVTGFAYLYINGNLDVGGIFGNVPIQNDADPFYVGGIGATSLAANKFKGQIDGVRVWKVERTSAEIKDNIFNDPTSHSNLTWFTFDKYTNAISNENTRTFAFNQFVGSAHISSSHTQFNNELTSPMLYDASGSFYSGYKNNSKRFFIPDNSLPGITDSVYIPAAGIVTGLKAYLLMSHTYTSDIALTLISPIGTAVSILNFKGSNGNDVMTIFSDAADSVGGGTAVNGPGINPPFSPGIKPDQPLSSFNGQNKLGWWKLKFIDNAGGDDGYVHGWGINISGPSFRTLQLKAFIQGFYRFSLHKMIKDTVSVILRNSTAPYTIVDTAKAVLDSTGNGTFVFDNAANGVPYYLVLRHRNSIETWSSSARTFSTDILYYDFAIQASQAYGNNMVYVDALAPPPPEENNSNKNVQTDGSTERYAIYSGDSNQDGIVDATDLSMIDNAAYNFVKGYVKTDVTGDNVVDASDGALADNNAYNFIGKITP